MLWFYWLDVAAIQTSIDDSFESIKSIKQTSFKLNMNIMQISEMGLQERITYLEIYWSKIEYELEQIETDGRVGGISAAENGLLSHHPN